MDTSTAVPTRSTGRQTWAHRLNLNESPAIDIRAAVLDRHTHMK
jgi:hypothetical protein